MKYLLFYGITPDSSVRTKQTDSIEEAKAYIAQYKEIAYFITIIEAKEVVSYDEFQKESLDSKA